MKKFPLSYSPTHHSPSLTLPSYLMLSINMHLIMISSKTSVIGLHTPFFSLQYVPRCWGVGKWGKFAWRLDASCDWSRELRGSYWEGVSISKMWFFFYHLSQFVTFHQVYISILLNIRHYVPKGHVWNGKKKVYKGKFYSNNTASL